MAQQLGQLWVMIKMTSEEEMKAWKGKNKYLFKEARKRFLAEKKTVVKPKPVTATVDVKKKKKLKAKKK